MLTLWRPHQELARWSRDFDDFLGRNKTSSNFNSFGPAVDVEELEDGFVLRADVPGLKEDDIDITLDDNELLISGNREETTEENSKGARIRERRFGKFSRRFALGQQVSTEGIEASYDNGVLTVRLPKKEEAKPRQIPVSVH